MGTHNDTVYVIAEAGVNHNGDLQRALAMIDVAAEAGADAVKFQTFVPTALVSAAARKADYQQHNDPQAESQLAMLERLTLDFDSHFLLLEHCEARGIDFLSSPFDAGSARFLLERLQLRRIKLGSGELTNAPLLWQLATAGIELILSTGMATLDEIHQALGLCCLALDGITPHSAQECLDAFDSERLQGRVSIMHCTTDYPCPFDQVNLRAMDTLRTCFGLDVGYSDHTAGIVVSLAAVARGARIIEKHFTLDRALPGPDHAASLEPGELTDLVAGIRAVSLALGHSEKTPGSAELRNAEVARKSLVAARPIRRGEAFDQDNLTTKRPGCGLAPLYYWSLLGTVADRDYATDEPIGEPR
ncbi:MAG TPA: N-acetylneuraminate synthase [Gammaproteobacteria bacterium]|nr:N-acetylneuraminate synthase [Gammaproteobacteria bacterium]